MAVLSLLKYFPPFGLLRTVSDYLLIMAGWNVEAAVSEGRPFRPTVFELAEIWQAWGPRTSDDLDIPASSDWSLVSWTTTTNRNNRVDLATWSGWRARKIFGFVAEISETKSENPDTQYRFEIISKLPYCAGVHREPAFSAVFSLVAGFQFHFWEI